MNLFSIFVASTGLTHTNMAAFLSRPGVVNYAEFTSDVSWARSVAGWIMQAHSVTDMHRDTDGHSWRGRKDLPAWDFPATVSWPPWASVQCHLPSQRWSLCLVPSHSSAAAPLLWERSNDWSTSPLGEDMEEKTWKTRGNFVEKSNLSKALHCVIWTGRKTFKIM